ncbi:MAG: hypothetical protein CMJ64_19175 [Planctomycetaceae bacterium]|nr:hypothetical protein [Planctomycetaceae bacterium]
MSPREGVYYAGLMGSIGCGAMVAQSIGWHRLIGAGIGFVVGLGVGGMLANAYSSSKSSGPGYSDPGKRDGDDYAQSTNISCPNSRCDWQGDRRHNIICPRCGQSLPSG